MRLPNRPLTDWDIMKHTQNIPHFRGVFMRDKLPKKPLKKECGVINLDSYYNSGTHWVAYVKYNDYVEYFDSFGDLKPPKNFITYIGDNINYNYRSVQTFDSFKCGHLCIEFLNNFWHSFKINK